MQKRPNNCFRDLLTVFLVLLLTTDVLSQKKDSLYVWDFTVSHPELKRIGEMLTNDFETELIGLGWYTVLERRKYNRVQAHLDMENRISDFNNLSTASKDSLRKIRAGVVIFGEVKDDFESGQYEVTVAFQRLDGEKFRQDFTLIGRGLINDNQTRKNKMRELVQKLHSKEFKEAKRSQFERVSEKLSTYMVRVKNVQKGFQDIARFAMNNDNYFEELGQTIIDYNLIFDDLHNNGSRYHMDFTKNWDRERGRKLKSILDGIMNDIHKTCVLKLDKVRMDIWEYRTKSMSKNEKKAKKEEIIRGVRTTTDDLKRQIDIMDIEISTFLSHLTTEMEG
ncbi:hypothetical protein [Poritiphilus flavus]|uniref:Uncharacterized protein n=1 Tax=Poritiphilus flavus TaxID=2697053 RepID=A0A6L9EFA9_9FLAO|nr:hypothetical protein [Poritiphilus flavus]NAS13188.1 hypothetical protein [Poritiphilus flavus]